VRPGRRRQRRGAGVGSQHAAKLRRYSVRHRSASEPLSGSSHATAIPAPAAIAPTLRDAPPWAVAESFAGLVGAFAAAGVAPVLGALGRVCRRCGKIGPRFPADESSGCTRVARTGRRARLAVLRRANGQGCLDEHLALVGRWESR